MEKKPTLEYAVHNIVNFSLNVESKDRLLVISDERNASVVQMIVKKAREKTKNVMVLVLEKYGKRPLLNLVSELVEDVKIFKPTVAINYFDKVAGEEPFRNELIDELLASKEKTRFVHLLAVPQDIFIKTVGIDYSDMYEYGVKLKKILDKVKSLKITSEIGTNLDINLYPGGSWHVESGKYRNQGEWGNLPDGELEILPMSADGEYAVAEFGSYFSGRYGIFKDEHPRLILKEGRLEGIITSNDLLRKDLESYFSIDSNSNRIGEFAIGINSSVTAMTGYSIVDEKKVGVHMALGSPHSLNDKGAFKCTTHLDALGFKSSVFADGKKIMEDDKLLI